MKIAIITDAWTPQINGVVKTLEHTIHQLRSLGHEVLVIEPGLFRSMACPSYPEIRLAIKPYRLLSKLLNDFSPDALHVATEGPLGVSARRFMRWVSRTQKDQAFVMKQTRQLKVEQVAANRPKGGGEEKRAARRRRREGRRHKFGGRGLPAPP